MTGNGQALLEVERIVKSYKVRGQSAFGAGRRLNAVDGVSFSLERGRSLGIVGESGCGKSTTARLILGLETPTSGAIRFAGRRLDEMTASERRDYRRTVQAVLQDPWASLDPRMRIGSSIAEPLEINTNLSRVDVRLRVEELLEHVGLQPDMAHQFPHEFSGGQRQRISVARALALEPQIVVLDEPVSALDVSVRAQIMNLLVDVRKLHDASYIMIAHDLATVNYLCHDVAVMYLGQVVEYGSSHEVFSSPQHPYTQALVSAAKLLGADGETVILPGEVPSPEQPPSGCRFHTRCPRAFDQCSIDPPALTSRLPERRVLSCHLYAREMIDTDVQRTTL